MEGDVECLTMWTIYGPNTSDHPGKYVVRGAHVVRVSRTDSITFRRVACTLHPSLDDARERGIPRGLFPMRAALDDDPVIIETWL